MDERTRKRFEAKVDRSGGPDACHPWKASRSRKYGRFRFAGRIVRASVLALEAKLGRPLGAGKKALHTCDNPPCVNEAHLYEGTQAQNVADREARGRTAKGARNGRSKLSDAAVADIKSRKARATTYAKRYGIAERSVHAIWAGEYRR